jgi:hypothetical protein
MGLSNSYGKILKYLHGVFGERANGTLVYKCTGFSHDFIEMLLLPVWEVLQDKVSCVHGGWLFRPYAYSNSSKTVTCLS